MIILDGMRGKLIIQPDEATLKDYRVKEKAFIEAQRLTYEGHRQTAAHMGMLPWFNAHVEEARNLMGDDYWPYGFEKNVATLQTFLKYHHESGLSKRLLKPEELFAPETLESYVI